MADRDIIRKELPPINPRFSITRADRSAVYTAIEKQLNDMLNGQSSYFDDGTQITDPTVQLERLQRLRVSLQAMRQNEVNDPEGVLKDIADELELLEKAVAGEIGQGDKGIVLDQKATPATRDQNEIYVAPYADPYSRNPLQPKNWNKYQDASLHTFEAPDFGAVPLRPGGQDVQAAAPSVAHGNNLQPPTPSSLGQQPASTARNLTERVLRMNGVPEADIGTALNDPSQMQDLLNQLSGRRPMIAPRDDENGFASNAGRDPLADRPEQASTQRAAAPDAYLPFGWAGLPPLLR